MKDVALQALFSIVSSMIREQLQWRRGVIECVEKNGQTIATKRAKDASVRGAIAKERDLLLLLNDRGVTFVPQLVDHGDDWFSYAWIEAEHFQDWWKKADDTLKKKLARELFECAYILDKAWVVHGELLRPTKNVLLTPEKKIAIIDFERGKIGDDRWKNMKAISQRMSRQWMISLETTMHLGTMKREEIYRTVLSFIEPKKNYLLPILIGGVLVDMITKWLFYDLEWGAQYLLLTPTFNPGIGWSIPVPLFFVILLTLWVCIGLVWMIRRKHIHQLWWILLLSGAIGNVIDRILYSWVRDFIDLQYRPIFNGADILITLGAIYIIRDEFL